jgi:heme exporter protein B
MLVACRFAESNRVCKCATYALVFSDSRLLFLRPNPFDLASLDMSVKNLLPFNFLAVLRKEFLLEYRSRYGVNTILLFVLISVSLVIFSISEELLSNELTSALMWNTAFFAALSALQRGFISEVERGTILFLNLSATPSAVFLGKLIYNFSLALLVNCVIALLYLAALSLRISNVSIFLFALFLGSASLSIVLTLVSAIVANTSARGGLFAVLSFVPLLIPIFMTIRATRIATQEDAPLFRASTELQILAVYSVVMFFVSFLLYEFIWEE